MKNILIFSLLYFTFISVATAQVKLYYAKDSLDKSKEIQIGVLNHDTIYSTFKDGSKPLAVGYVSEGGGVYELIKGEDSKSVFFIDDVKFVHYNIQFSYKNIGYAINGIVDGIVLCPRADEDTAKGRHYGYVDVMEWKNDEEEQKDIWRSESIGAIALLEYLSPKIYESPYKKGNYQKNK